MKAITFTEEERDEMQGGLEEIQEITEKLLGCVTEKGGEGMMGERRYFIDMEERPPYQEDEMGMRYGDRYGMRYGDRYGMRGYSSMGMRRGVRGTGRYSRM